jgi:hypothetical protein
MFIEFNWWTNKCTYAYKAIMWSKTYEWKWRDQLLLLIIVYHSQGVKVHLCPWDDLWWRSCRRGSYNGRLLGLQAINLSLVLFSYCPRLVDTQYVVSGSNLLCHAVILDQYNNDISPYSSKPWCCVACTFLFMAYFRVFWSYGVRSVTVWCCGNDCPLGEYRVQGEAPLLGRVRTSDIVV